jgi:hypothetical protein
MYDLDEGLKAERLDKVAVRAEIIAIGNIRILSRGGENDHRDRPHGGNTLDFFEHFASVLFGRVGRSSGPDQDEVAAG